MNRSIILATLLWTLACVGGMAWADRAYVDFTPYPNGAPDCFDMQFVRACGVDNNPYYKNSMRLLVRGSYAEFAFHLPDNAYNINITLDHLSSASQQAYNGGWSPVHISLNRERVVYDYSPDSHSYIRETWSVGRQAVSGRNVLRIEAADLQTHYWLQRVSVLWNRPPVCSPSPAQGCPVPGSGSHRDVHGPGYRDGNVHGPGHHGVPARRPGRGFAPHPCDGGRARRRQAK